jgi:lipoprotein-anchoring transpeptidase ErfK/SrfK
MSALRLLALSYLASASVFVVAATMVARPDLARQFAASAGRLAQGAAEHLQPPAAEGPVVRLTLAPPAPSAVPAPVRPRESRQVEARNQPSNPDVSGLSAMPILPDLSPESAPVPPEPKMIGPKLVEPRPLQQGSKVVRVAPVTLPPPARTEHRDQDRTTVAMARLKDKLTPDMVRHFELIVYVSKARSGLLGQRMLVVQNKDGALKPLHEWPVSTGREQDEISPRGRASFTATPKGYYELDPDRMYRRYHSWNWDQDMPYAMFFNWERRGVETGLAIHAATGKDVDKLGKRASAGCVHLAPEHAASLYHLILHDYSGHVPRFAYNQSTDTMSNSGNFMRDKDGQLKMSRGYRVLVIIDDYAGEDRLAELD